jgi:hypothetical protein
MTSQRINWWVVSGSVLLVGISLQSNSAQQPGDDPFAPREELRIDPRRVDFNSPPRWNDGTQIPIAYWSVPDSKSAIRKAAEELRDAESDEARDQAEDKLRELLSKYFDEDMQRREADLKAMESRLKKLQEQLARRHDKMQEIVDFQIKVLINEADGLGFFSSPSPPMGLPSAANPFYSSRTAEEGTTITDPAQPRQPILTRQPVLPPSSAAPIPTERQPSQPLEPSVPAATR